MGELWCSTHGISCWFSTTGEGKNRIPAVASLRVKGSCCLALIFIFPITASFSAKWKNPKCSGGHAPARLLSREVWRKPSYPSSHSWGGLSRWICAWRSSACAQARENVFVFYFCIANYQKLSRLKQCPFIILQSVSLDQSPGTVLFSARVLTRLKSKWQQLPSFLDLGLLFQGCGRIQLFGFAGQRSLFPGWWSAWPLSDPNNCLNPSPCGPIHLKISNGESPSDRIPLYLLESLSFAFVK